MILQAIVNMYSYSIQKAYQNRYRAETFQHDAETHERLHILLFRIPEGSTVCYIAT